MNTIKKVNGDACNPVMCEDSNCCEWVDGCDGYWKTDCHNQWIIDNEDKKVSMNFCPMCGRRLRIL